MSVKGEFEKGKSTIEQQRSNDGARNEAESKTWDIKSANSLADVARLLCNINMDKRPLMISWNGGNGVKGCGKEMLGSA